ncbi:NUDIX hydrolase domain-like protein [Mycena latifolia]|nr:NUDIX hydrolase domain-like protein [Mycena latifolia]
MSSKPLSNLDLVNICGNMRVPSALSPIPSEFDSEELLPFHLSDAPNSPIIGLLRPEIVELLRAENARGPEVWAGVSTPGAKKISFVAEIDTHAKRTALMKEMCERWRDTGRFADIIGPSKWRAEMYPVYKDPFGAHDHPQTAEADKDAEQLNFAFEMERAACALFGIVTYGVHLSMYQESADGNGLRIWVPTRASTKSMWPGYLDNTVAGGIPSGMPIFEALVKECMEEASLGEDLVRAHTRSVSCISYFYRTAKGWLQPEVEYLYDLVIPADADPAAFEPKPLDGEVASFDFLDKDQIDSAMRAGRFKPNCAVALIDLFIRLGYITPDNEPDFLKIVTALHTTFDYERWSLGA